MDNLSSIETSSGSSLAVNTRVKRDRPGGAKRVTWNIPGSKEKEKIRILQFNVSSLKDEIYEIIREEKPYVICLQEIRKKLPDTTSYNWRSVIRTENR